MATIPHLFIEYDGPPIRSVLARPGRDAAYVTATAHPRLAPYFPAGTVALVDRRRGVEFTGPVVPVDAAGTRTEGTGPEGEFAGLLDAARSAGLEV